MFGLDGDAWPPVLLDDKSEAYKTASVQVKKVCGRHVAIKRLMEEVADLKQQLEEATGGKTSKQARSPARRTRRKPR